jgi:multicomponent Na+:H+ antiporter subunit B
VTRRTRLVVFTAAAVIVAAVLAHGLAGLPAFGDFHGVDGLVLGHVSVVQRHATDVVSAITFDYRGLDTMGEEFILFAASIGVVVLLREQRDEHSESEDQSGQGTGADGTTSAASDRPHTSPALIVVGRLLVGPTLVLGVYVASHGQLTPGGGFQGGVILAAAVIIVFVAGGRVATAPIRPSGGAEMLEAASAGGYVALGVGGLIAGGRFLTNFLPLGMKGSLLSGGTIASLSAVVGLEVAGAITLIVSAFVDQRLVTRTGR